MVKKPARPPLTVVERAQLARAALDNAVALLEDARVLLDARRWPRAYALAVLAAEEFGKFHSCVAAVRLASDDAPRWARFWKDFVLHKPKFAAWAGVLTDELYADATDGEWSEAWDTRDRLAASGNSHKQAAFYVDFANGQVHAPAIAFQENAARQAIDVVGFVVDKYARLFEGDLVNRFSSMSEKLQALFAEMENVTTPEEFQGIADECLSAPTGEPTV